MMNRKITELQTTASELDALANQLETLMRDMGSFAGNHVTMVVDVSKNVTMTLIPATLVNPNKLPMVQVDGKHIQKAAYAALAFRMAMIRLNEPDVLKRPPAFADMLPDIIGELYFLQDFILMTFAEETDLAVSVEYESGGTGLIKTLCLTTAKKGNVYRTQVQGCSMALRSDHHYFDLLDSVRNGSVMAMVAE